LDIPYDDRFRRQDLAYIVGLSQLGLEPLATLGIPGGERRLDRILALIQSCRYSIHDLSRMEMDRKPPPTPRFNMPCELGMTIAWQKLNPSRHTWFVFESRHRRLQKSLSDLDGTDPNLPRRNRRGRNARAIECLRPPRATTWRARNDENLSPRFAFA
jgi:hypothetical protein